MGIPKACHPVPAMLKLGTDFPFCATRKPGSVPHPTFCIKTELVSVVGLLSFPVHRQMRIMRFAASASTGSPSDRVMTLMSRCDPTFTATVRYCHSASPWQALGYQQWSTCAVSDLNSDRSAAAQQEHFGMLAATAL
jgi:hypothetical protein